MEVKSVDQTGKCLWKGRSCPRNIFNLFVFDTKLYHITLHEKVKIKQIIILNFKNIVDGKKIKLKPAKSKVGANLKRDQSRPYLHVFK